MFKDEMLQKRKILVVFPTTAEVNSNRQQQNIMTVYYPLPSKIEPPEPGQRIDIH